MRQGIAVLGIVGLGVVLGSAPANAVPVTSPPGGMICHANEAGMNEPFFVSSHGMIMDLNGHKGHLSDIIPFPGFGGDPNGQNMTPENVVILNNGCVGAVATAAPVSPPVATYVPVPAPAAGALNLGYNVDGAVQVKSGAVQVKSGDDDTPFWLAAAAVLLAAVAALVAWSVKARTRNAVR